MMKESRELLKQLKLIFATIIRFCKAQENLYTTAMHAKQVEGMRQQLIGRRELDVHYCISPVVCRIVLDTNGFGVYLVGFVGNTRGRRVQRAIRTRYVRGQLEDLTPN